MKHSTKFLVAMLMVLVGNIPANAYDFEYGGIYYDIISADNSTCKVTYENYDNRKYSSSYSNEVYIPETVSYNGDDYTVTTIGEGAFYGCTSLTSISIPPSIILIEEYAFERCTGLTNVKITDLSAWCRIKLGYKSLSGNYDYNANPLAYAHNLYLNNKLVTELVIPSDITFIPDYAFYGCSCIKNVVLHDNVASMGYQPFKGCDITAPVYNKKLFAFMPSTFQGEYVMPKGINRICSGAFYNCDRLSSITFPSSLMVIDEDAFEGCTGLVKVNITDLSAWCNVSSGHVGSEDMYVSNPLQYSHKMYLNKELITDLVIPSDVAYISQCAFYGCTEIKSVTIPESVTSIGEQAFGCCVNLSTVYNWSKLNIVKGSYWNGMVAYYAKEVITSKYVVYNGDSEKIETGMPEKYATAPNALVFYSKSDKQTEKNYVNSDNEAKSIVLSDAYPFYCPTNIRTENLSYTKAFTNTAWQPLYIPFSMEYEDWADKADVAYINNVHQWDDDGDGEIDRTILEFITKKSGEIKANTPYVIRPKQTGEVTFTSENTTLYATPETDGFVDCMSTTTKYVLAGTYQNKTDMKSSGCYGMVDGQFRPAESDDVTLSPFRIYLKIESRDGAGSVQNAKRVGIMVDGVVDNDATGIEELTQNSSIEPQNCYSLAGQKVGGNYKGIIVRNGKKYLVK